MSPQEASTAPVDVLIADDDPLLRESLRLVLELAGYKCVEARDGQQTVEQAQRSQPRCVLLDLSMPGLDGITVVRQLRADQRTRDAHIHCLTGRSDQNARQQLLQAGCETCLVKPVDVQQLLAVVRSHLASERTMQSNAAVPPLVLVADDNADTADSLALLLRLSGYRFVVAYDGPTALAQAQAHLPPVAVLDLGLPRLDGCAVAKKMRTTAGLEKCLLIALTGHGLEQDRQLCRAAGFDHFLLKPADLDDVLRLLPPLL